MEGLQLTQCYLEMARAYFGELKGKDWSGWEDDPVRANAVTNVEYALLAGIITFSYMAIDAFVIKTLQDQIQKANESPERRQGVVQALKKKIKFVDCEKCQPNYELISRKPLKDRILILREILVGGDQKSFVESKLWNDFNDFAKVARHFVVHPNPDPTSFDKGIREISTKESGLYPKIAQEVISYFYDPAFDGDQPKWLDENQLFTLHVEMLPWDGINPVGR